MMQQMMLRHVAHATRLTTTSFFQTRKMSLTLENEWFNRAEQNYQEENYLFAYTNALVTREILNDHNTSKYTPKHLSPIKVSDVLINSAHKLGMVEEVVQFGKESTNDHKDIISDSQRTIDSVS
jgi:hypothetical protein